MMAESSHRISSIRTTTKSKARTITTTDLLKWWHEFSSLQKLLIILFSGFMISLLTSQGSVMCILISAIFGGIYLTNEFMLHERTSFYAEQIFDKVESVYLDIKLFVVSFNSLQKEEHKTPVSDALELQSDDSEGETASSPSSQDEPSQKTESSLHLEINSIQLLIVRDFVRSWYNDFSYDNEFLKDVKLLLHEACEKVTIQLSLQSTKVILGNVINLYLTHLILFKRSKSVYDSHQIHPKTKVPSDSKVKRHISIEQAFEDKNVLHVALENEKKELEYLKSTLNILVFSLLQKEVNEGPCSLTLLVEILSNKMLVPIMDLISEPDWFAEVIVLLTSDEEVVKGSIDNSYIDSCESLNAHNSSVWPDTDTFDGKQIDTVTICPNVKQTDDHEEETDPIFKDCDNLPSMKAGCIHDNLKTEEPSSSSLQQDLDLPLSKSLSDPSNRHLLDEEFKSVHDPSLYHDHLKTSSNNSIKNDWIYVKPDQHFPSTKDILSIDSDIQCASNLPKDPQEILSFESKRPLTDMEMSASFEELEDKTSFTEVSGDDSDAMSFPKLTSFRNFLGSFKQKNVKKPKTLNISPEENHPKDSSDSVPKVLVDGETVGESFKNTSDDQQHPPNGVSDGVKMGVSESRNTPSPQYFASVHSLFSKSSSCVDLRASQESLIDTIEISKTSSMVSSQDFTDSVSDTEDSELSLGLHKTNGLSLIEQDDPHIFQDLSIQKTEISTEYRSSNQFCLYVIEYEALHFTEEGKSVVKSNSVKRRHREFMSLYERLEAHSTYRKYLKKIRNPKRWTSLSFKSMVDRDSVESRRSLLETYLKDLIKVEAICNGPDLREFLAYEGNSHIAFVKKSPNISVPRFDKMFMSTVSGMVDRIKAIPTITQEKLSELVMSNSTEDGKFMVDEDMLDEDIIDLNIGILDDDVIEGPGPVNRLPRTSHTVVGGGEVGESWEHEREPPHQDIQNVVAGLLSGGHSNNGSTVDEPSPKDPPLSMAVLDLLVEGLQGHDLWLCKDRVVHTLKAVLGKALDRYLEVTIHDLTSDLQLTSYLHLLRDTLWPQGQLWTNSRLQRSPEERTALLMQAKRCLTEAVPKSLRIVIGHEEFDQLLDVFLDSLSSKQLNRHCLYQTLDLLVDHLLPEASQAQHLQDMLMNKARAGWGS